MIATFILGVFCVLFAWLEDYKNFNYGLKIGFGFIFLFLALRYDFGNDYMPYYNFFYGVEDLTDDEIHSEDQHFEIGWIYLNKIFYNWGFFTMQMTLASINCIVYYYFIKKYCPKHYYWFAMFLYVFSSGIMLTHSSAMRQSIAIAIFLISLSFLQKKQLLRYIILIGIASLIHTSALILSPLILLPFINFRISFRSGLITFSIFLLLFIYANFILSNITSLSGVYFERYAEYLDNEGVMLGSGLGLIFLSILLILILKYSKYQTKENSLLFKLAILNFMFIPMGFALQSVGRLGMYFLPVTIVVYPLIICTIKSNIIRSIITTSIVLVTLYTFYQFFQSEVWKEAFGTYQTIFSSELY